jgi:hypothetical protein
MMLKKHSFWVYVSLLACLIACIGDLAALMVFTHIYKGYNPNIQPISALGALGSPIAREVSCWWIFIGSVFLLFAYAYAKSDAHQNSAQRLTAWLIAIYAVGEEIGSGVFPGNHFAGHLTSIGIIHNVIGGIGISALVIAPFVLMKKYTRADHPSFNYFLWTISILGILVFLIFSISRSTLPELLWMRSQHGLWQRLFVADYYAFLIAIASKLLLEHRTSIHQNGSNLLPPR